MKKQFAFKGDANGLYLFVQDVLEELRVNLNDLMFREIRANCQMVLIELLTNALKHSGVETSLIEVYIDEEFVAISRIDHGIPLHFVVQADQEKHTAYPFELVLYHDDLFTLKGIVAGKYDMGFKITEHPLTNTESPYNLSEHFGLMIITKASKTFRFYHDEKSGKNFYTVILGI